MKKDSFELISNPSTKYLANIEPFVKSFFGGLDCSFSHQFKDMKDKLSYYPCNSKMSKELLQEHFYSPPTLVESYSLRTGWKTHWKVGDSFKGSLGVVATYNNQVKWVCFDLDEIDLVKKAEQGLLPKLKELNIDFLEELGGDSLERRHIWIKVSSHQVEAKTFFTSLLREVYKYESDNLAFQDFQEVFGVNKPSNLIRLPLGWHLKRDNRFPIKLKNGNLTDDPGDFLEYWLSLKELTSERMLEIVKTFNIQSGPIQRKANSFGKGRAFSFFPRHLPLPDIKLPQNLIPVFENCQAANEVLTEIVSNKMIEQRGEVHHSAGLFIGGMAAFSDSIRTQREKGNRVFVAGKKWFEQLVDTYRLRDDQSHSWFNSFFTAKTDPYRVFASCEKWDEKFDKCKGCPYKPYIHSPREFMSGTSITKKFIRPIKLTTAEEIRRTTFQRVRERINYLLESGMHEDMLLASPQGAGKSWESDSIACDLSKRGFRVLIAVPSTALAMEHKKRLRDCGVDAFVLSSHNAIFTKGISKFECPTFDEIQKKIKLGVSSTTIKKTHCHNCPLYDDCHYPSQYKDVLEEQHNIVIIQHAHFSAAEVMHELMKKKFDILFVDETFIDNCYDSIPILEYETEILKEFGYKWTTNLAAWLMGGIPKTKKMEANEDELDHVKKYFDGNSMSWRVPDLIRHYNQGRLVNPYVGIEVVYDIPKIPIRIFTDATPPERLIKHLTGIDTLAVYGRDEAIDYRKSHPDHHIVQVLNFSASVSSIKKDEKLFEDILMKIGELVELKYTTGKTLITCYKGLLPKIEEFFLAHQLEFPTAMSRITLDCMNKGTNKYEDYDVQFLLAGVFFTGYQYYLDAYKYQTVANHYNIKKGRELYNARYPHDYGQLAGINKEWVNVERVEEAIRGTALYEYPNYQVLYPTDVWHNMIWEYNNSVTQQAVRIRFKTDHAKVVYVLTNVSLPGFLITDTIRIDEFIRPLEQIDLLY